MGSILLAVETVRSNATEVLDAAVAMAVSYERDFPGLPEMIAIALGRIRQRNDPRFLGGCLPLHHAGRGAAGLIAAHRVYHRALGLLLQRVARGPLRSRSDGQHVDARQAVPLVSDKGASTSVNVSHGGSTLEDGDDSDSKTLWLEETQEWCKKSKERSKAGSVRALDGGGNRSPGGRDAAATRDSPLCRKGAHFP